MSVPDLYPLQIGPRFKNPNPLFRKRSPLAVAKWILWDGPRRKKLPSFGILWHRDGDGTLPLPHDHQGSEFLRTNRSLTTITWIGHSSFLIQMDGTNLLIDPVWSDRVFGKPGPRRFVAPGLPLSVLPEIDMICISHNHYDHLDMPTLRTFGNTPQYVVPLGINRFLARHGITNVRALSWWEHLGFGPLRIHSVPAQHFSVRSPFDHNRTLWAGWLIEGTRFRIYYAGDTGYFEPQFRQIKDRFAPIHVAILPIGAYQPSWLMRPVHLSPAEAVDAFQILEAEILVPCHWGTFKLSEEALGVPPHELQRTAEERNISPDSLRILEPGKTLKIGDGQ